MKLKLLYLLPLIAAFASGCSKDNVVATPQLTVPAGTYGGSFARFHVNATTGVADTLNASLSLTIDASGNYAVAGDTLTVHAGSYGTVSLGIHDELVFTDKTLPPTGTPAKQHLSGTYAYTYGSGILELAKNFSDTLSYQYHFVKSN